MPYQTTHLQAVLVAKESVPRDTGKGFAVVSGNNNFVEVNNDGTIFRYEDFISG